MSEDVKKYPIDKVIGAYVKARDRKTELQATIKEEVSELNEVLGVFETELMGRAKELGVDSFKTDAGTAFTKEASSVTVKDWDALLKQLCATAVGGMVLELHEEHRIDVPVDLLRLMLYKHFPFQFFKRDVVKTAVEEYIEENEQMLPPGIDLYTRMTVQVRRPKA